MLNGAGQKPQADIVFGPPLPPERGPLLGEHVNPPAAADERDRVCLRRVGQLHELWQPALDIAIDL